LRRGFAGDSDAIVTIREAAQLVGRTPATIRRYIRAGRLPARKDPGKFGEEYQIDRADLLALGLTAVADPPVTAIVPATQPAAIAAPLPSNGEPLVPASVFNELLMKHEQMLVQYGMIRAGGQKLLEYKAAVEEKVQENQRLRDRYEALRARAGKEIQFLRKHLRQAEIEVEDRNIEIVLLQEKIKRLEQVATDATRIEGVDRALAEIREKEESIARIENLSPASPALPADGAWVDPYERGRGNEDH
jgi:excisionase family DNA binding protein